MSVPKIPNPAKEIAERLAKLRSVHDYTPDYGLFLNELAEIVARQHEVLVELVHSEAYNRPDIVNTLGAAHAFTNRLYKKLRGE